MPKYSNYYDIAITNAGGTIDLNISDPYEFYNVDGTGIVLANDLDITTSDPGVKGVTYNINYDGNSLDINGHDLTIFGVILTAAQALIKLQITSYYDGTDWITTVKPSVDTAFVESVNIVSNTVCTENLCDDVNTEIIVIPISFESGLQAHNDFLMPYKYEIIDFWIATTKAIAGTDDATITIRANNFPVWDITIPASTVINTRLQGNLIQSGAVASGTWIEPRAAKTTVGGSCLATITIKRSV